MSTADEPEQSVGTLAIGGAVVVLLRSAGIAGFALIGNVVLARLLLPSEFGLVAFGITLVAAGTFLAEGGMAIDMCVDLQIPCRPNCGRCSVCNWCSHRSPRRALLRSRCRSEAGRVTAFMVLSLPILAFRTPGFILLERALDFRRLVAVEISEAVLYHAWAIAAVWVGWGVWGFASATLVCAVVGTVAMFRVSPVSLLRPSFAWSTARSQLSFGSRFQAAQIANFARYQGLNAGTVAIA